MTLIAAAICQPGISQPGGQSPKKDSDVSTEARVLVRAAIASTGIILVRNSGDPSSQGARPRGSAVVIRSNGIVATNHHVITNVRTGRLYDELMFSLAANGDPLTSPTRYRLKAVMINKEYDLALLAIDANADGTAIPQSVVFPTVEIADSRKIRLLEDLFIIGFPEKGGTSVTVNRGVVEGQDLLAKWIKTDARVIHGNSGGAAVNSDGKLVGIPTKVVADEQPVDKDGDGFPDDYRRYGAVGFLRPSYLLVEMLSKLDQTKAESLPAPAQPEMVASQTLIPVSGVVKSSTAGTPIVGALVGLLPLGESTVSESTLLTWGSTNAQGEFKLNKAVPPGRYVLRAKALGNRLYTREIELSTNTAPLIIELLASNDR